MGGDELRFGVIGTGMMGCEHLRNLAALPGATVAAIADPHETSRQWGRDAAGADVAVFEDHAHMLDEVELDAVVVATPNHTHLDVLDPIWATGLNVMVEKPLCTTVADCLEVRDRAAAHRGLVWVGLEDRYMPAITQLLARADGGDAGRVRMVSIREHRFPFLDQVGDWNRFNRNTGGTLVEK